MRLSNLAGKEVINLSDGARLGVIEECELTFDDKSGKILTMILPPRNKLFSFFGDTKSSTIPWQTIRRIGDEVIIVDINNAYTNFNRERRENTY